MMLVLSGYPVGPPPIGQHPYHGRVETPPALEYPRSFRADIQAVRALAVIVVVMYHAGIPGFHGGYLGVDVFFVISGFVITGVLLAERETTGRTSIATFYGHRIRRILPMGTLVLIASVFATYHWLGFVSGHANATDAIWVSLFVGNIHFANLGTDYFGSNLPPSTLQQYWSLAVEEQFYLLWPLTFMLFAATGKRWSIRTKLVPVLLGLMAVSLLWCIVQTTQSQPTAFFSLPTRAWELALGALLAVIAPWIRDRSASLGMALIISGYLVIIACTWFYSSSTQWPGTAVILPVAATAAVLAGGTLRESLGSGRVTTSAPVQWLGTISYSLYLVHWPLIVIAAQSVIHPLPLWIEIGLVALSIAISSLVYRYLEGPIRQARVLRERPAMTFAFGAALILLSLGTTVWHLHHYSV